MNYRLLAIAIFPVLAFLLPVRASVYFDVDSAVPADLDGWSAVSSGDFERGDVLAASAAGSAFSVAAPIPEGGVVTFLARGTGDNQASIRLVAGTLGTLDVALTPNSWTRVVFPVAGDGSLQTVSVVLSSGSAQIDEFYAGRQLQNPDASGNADVWQFRDDDDGLILSANGDGVYDGAWKPAYFPVDYTWTFDWAETAGNGFVGDTLYGRTGNTNELRCVSPISSPLSDYVLVEYEVKYQAPRAPDKHAFIHPILSTNEWAGEIAVGPECDMMERGGSEEWLSVTNVCEIPGIQNRPDVLLGFSIRTSGGTQRQTCIRNVSVSYRSRAVADGVGFYANGTITNSVPVGSDPRVAVHVSKTSDAVVSGVSLSQTRPGSANAALSPLAWTLEKVSASSSEELWVSAETVSEAWNHALEAGETNAFAASVSFASSLGLVPLPVDDAEVTANVTGDGQIWINEFANGVVELAGKNGLGFTNWTVRAVVDGTDAVLASLGSVTGELGRPQRGVGFALVEGLPTGALDGMTIRLQLLNSSGIVENETGPFAYSGAEAWAATGKLPDKSSGDWTRAGSAFDWAGESADAVSMSEGGHLNADQTVDLPVRLLVRFASTKVGGALVDFSPGFSGLDTNVLVRIGRTPEKAEDDGTGTVEEIYWSEVLDTEALGWDASHEEDSLSADRVSASLSAFGRAGNPVFEKDVLDFSTAERLATNTIAFVLSSSIGREDFSSDFRDGNWILWSRLSSGAWGWDAAGGHAIANVAYGANNRMEGYMQTGIPLETDRRHAKIAFDIQKNNPRSDWNKYLRPVVLDTNEVAVVRFRDVDNVYGSGVANGAWQSVCQRAVLPEAGDGEYLFRVEAYGNGGNTVINFDDLYLSFQDWVSVSSCEAKVEMPEAGSGYPVDWTLDVGAGGATNVQAKLVASLSRTGRTVTNLLWDSQSMAMESAGWTRPEAAAPAWTPGGEVPEGRYVFSTNLLAAAGFSDGDGEPAFVAKDELEYFFVVDFDARNGALPSTGFDRDRSFYPDNSSTDASTGIWSVTGGYGPDPVSVTAWGPQPAWVNEVFRSSASGASWVEFAGRVHGGADAAPGSGPADIAGWKVVVVSDVGADAATVPVPAGWAWGNAESDVGFYVLSGLSLPEAGGLRVVDGEGRVRYMLSWNSAALAGKGYASISDSALAAGFSLAARTRGNVANATSWDWVSTNADTQGAANDGQVLANGGPIGVSLRAVAGEISPSSIGLAAVASDIDEPVEFGYSAANALSGEAAATSGGFETNAVWTAAGLAQNTPYDFAVETRDALGEPGESATASAWTLLDSWSASAAGSATNEIGLSVAIDNLGEGDTAWSVEGLADGLTGTSFAASSPDWTPNSPHRFRLAARNGAGTPSVRTHDIVAYTKASAPRAAPAATADPNAGVFVSFDLPAEGFADALADNPEDTEYALRAWLYRKGAADPADPDVVDWDVSKSGAGSGAAPGGGTWQTLAAWTNSFATARWDCDITPTNIVFAFVARNNGENKVESVSEFSSEAHFELAVTTGSPTQRRDGSGLVDVADVLVVNPFGNDITGLALEFSADAGKTWGAATLLSATDGTVEYASGGKAAGIPVPNGTVALSAVWDALADLGRIDSDAVALRWKAETANAALEDNPADAGALDIRLARPSATGAVYAGTLRGGKAKRSPALDFEVKFDDAVGGLVAAATVAGTARSGVTATPKPAGAALSDTWTVSVPMSEADDALDSAEVVLTSLSGALDDFGNEMPASAPAVSVAYDGKAPSVALAGATAPFKASDAPWRVTATFSEPVDGVAAADLALVNATAALVSGGDGGTVFAFDVSPVKDGQVSVSFEAGAATDAAGNGNTASSALSRTYDTVAPVPTLALKSGTSPRNVNKFEVSVSFSENVTGLAASDFVLSSGATATLSGSGKSYTLALTCPDNSAQTGAATTVTLPADKCQDAAGNPNAAAERAVSVVYDKIKPTVALSSETPANFNAAQSPMVVTATFAEPVSGVAAADLSLVNATATLASGKDGDKTFTFRVVPSGDGQVSVSFKDGAATDAAGNANSASATLSRTYDGTAPRVVSISVDPDGYFDRGDGPVLAATVEFSEAMDPASLKGVLALGNAGYQGGGSSAPDAPVDVDGDGKKFLWLLRPLAEGPVSIEVSAKAADLAGNPLASAVRYGKTLVYDDTAPAVALSGAPAAAASAGDFAIGISAADANSGAGLAMSWSVLRDGVVVASGAGDGAGPWTARHSGLGEGSYLFAATVADAAGNAGTASCGWRVTRAAPSASIAPAASPAKGDTASFTVTFSEPVHGLEVADFEVLGGDIVGSLTSVEAAAPSVAYEVRVLAARPGTTVGLALPAHSATNALGIGNAAAAAATCEVDYTAPSVGPLAVSPARARTGAEVSCFFDVEDANLASVSVDGQTATALPGAGNGVARFAFAAAAASSAAFAVTAVDAVGNSTRTILANPLVIDDAAPELAWSGVPATGEASAASAQFAATLASVVDDDPDVTFRWAVVSCEDAETLPGGWGGSDEDWSAWSGAVAGSVVATNGLESGEDYAFVVQARDSAGNESLEIVFWTQSEAAEPASEGGSEISEPLISGDVATFAVSWDDPAAAFDAGSFFLRTNALSVASVETVPGSFDSATGKTNVTVAVTTSGRLPGASVELVVPAGALGSEDDSSRTAAFEVPVLTYLGRSFDDPNVLEWKLEGVSARPAAASFAVVDPSEDSVGTVADKNKPAAAVREVSGSAASGWTISVDDHAYDYVGPDGIDVKSHSSNSDAGNTNWMDHVFVNWRLAYGAATSAAPAEVNLALPAFGGNIAVNTEPDVDMAYDREWGATTTKFDFTLDWSKTTADSISRNRNRANVWAFWGDTGDRKSVIWTNAPVAIRSMQWTLAPGASLDRVQAFPEPVSDDSTICNLSGDLSAVRLDFTTNSVLGADKGQIRGMENAAKRVRFSNFAVMGAPARFACETPVPRLALADTVRDAEGQGVVRVRDASEAAFCAVDGSKIAVSWSEGAAGPDAFAVANRTEKGFDLVFEGVSGEGRLSVALEEGALVNAGTAAGFVAASPETSATFLVDIEAPAVASMTGSDAAGDGNPVFVLTLGEDASGVELGGFSVAVSGASGAPAGEAAVSSFSRSGNVVTVGVHASSWEPGSTLSLSWEGTLRDASGNEASASASASVALPADPATEPAASVAVSAGEGGTVSPAGTRWFAPGEAEKTLGVVATPNAGYEFSGWTLSGAAAVDAGAASTTVSVVSAGASATATFAPAGSVSVAVACGANGSASWTGTGHVAKGGSTNVLFAAAQGCRIASVTTNGVAVAGAAGQGSCLVPLYGLRADVTVLAAFEPVPGVGISVTDGGVVAPPETVAWNGDWTRTFAAPDGMEIDGVAVDGAAIPAAAGAAAYTVQLFGVISDTEVVATYRDVAEPPRPAGFRLENLAWTAFDPVRGVAAFAATAEGDAPASVSALWVVSPGAASTNKAEGCVLSRGEDGTWTVSGVPTNLDALFLVGLEVGD